MTKLEFIAVLGIALVSYCISFLGMAFPKQGRIIQTALMLIGLAGIAFAFWLGFYWNHTDLTCHVGQHCFPWGY